MARIMDDLKVQLNADGTSWSLLEPLIYHVGSVDSQEIVEVSEGFPTDFASVPWFARWFISTWQKTGRAVVVHDYLYSMEGRRKYEYTRRQADGIFLEILKVMRHKRRWFAWLGVRVGGWWVWRSKQRKDGAAPEAKEEET